MKKHDWKFFSDSGLRQVRIECGEDLRNLKDLDQKHWTVLAASNSGLRFDSRTLELLDTDGDGRIRVPEILAAVEFLESKGGDLDSLFTGKVDACDTCHGSLAPPLNHTQSPAGSRAGGSFRGAFLLRVSISKTCGSRSARPVLNCNQPCFCLCLGFSQMTITRPLRLMILHFSQMGLTEGLTFILSFLLALLFGRLRLAAPGDSTPGQIIG